MKVLTHKPPYSATPDASTTIVLHKEAPTIAASREEAPAPIAPHKEAPLEVPHGEGSSRHRDKAVPRPRSIRDLCRVRARGGMSPSSPRKWWTSQSRQGRSHLKLGGPR
ncbi:hypothetical protein BHE74_00046100 [Ensete ventricosum]|uniref:Uncharacterized protein n=1 Tax=Ensete ventricosum TaxID=4639 RepID=A0A445ML71_ENSVE|nr:hypothetical protein BHE74_00046100 [Ensete ventricosum]RZR75024.1 hypothetical protein BHM03_00047787 [Ensete ventricosum]